MADTEPPTSPFEIISTVSHVPRAVCPVRDLQGSKLSEVFGRERNPA